MTDTLFEMPPKVKRKRKPFVKTQRWTCKRCKDGYSDDDAIYCDKHDLCLEATACGDVMLVSRWSKIACDGERWTY